MEKKSMRTAWFLALRYLRPRRSAVSVITLISVIGVTLGVAVLIVVLAVMTGFTDEMKAKLIQTQAHLHVAGGHFPISDPERVKEAVLEAGGTRAAAVIAAPALLQQDGRFEPKFVFGADADDVRENMAIGKALQPGGRFDLNPGETVIGSRLAARFGLAVGDRIVLHSPSRLTRMLQLDSRGRRVNGTSGAILLPSEYVVTGIVNFHKYDVDRDVIFLNLTDAADLFEMPWGSATAVYGWVPDPFAVEPALKKLQARFRAPFFKVDSWQTLNAQFLSVLQVEKNMMFFLLIFIVLVAAFSIANTLITSVCQKTREIGLLKALGARDGQVMQIFLLQGFLVGVIGSAVGTLLGVLVVAYRMTILRTVAAVTGRELFPAELYYFDELPAHVVPGDAAVIVIASVLLCTLGGIVPALRAARLAPANALRYE